MLSQLGQAVRAAGAQRQAKESRTAMKEGGPGWSDSPSAASLAMKDLAMMPWLRLPLHGIAQHTPTSGPAVEGALHSGISAAAAFNGSQGLGLALPPQEEATMAGLFPAGVCVPTKAMAEVSLLGPASGETDSDRRAQQRYSTRAFLEFAVPVNPLPNAYLTKAVPASLARQGSVVKMEEEELQGDATAWYSQHAGHLSGNALQLGSVLCVGTAAPTNASMRLLACAGEVGSASAALEHCYASFAEELRGLWQRAGLAVGAITPPWVHGLSVSFERIDAAIAPSPAEFSSAAAAETDIRITASAATATAQAMARRTGAAMAFAFNTDFSSPLCHLNTTGEGGCSPPCSPEVVLRSLSLRLVHSEARTFSEFADRIDAWAADPDEAADAVMARLCEHCLASSKDKALASAASQLHKDKDTAVLRFASTFVHSLASSIAGKCGRCISPRTLTLNNGQWKIAVWYILGLPMQDDCDILLASTGHITLAALAHDDIIDHDPSTNGR